MPLFYIRQKFGLTLFPVIFVAEFRNEQVVSLQTELSYMQAHLATLELPQPPPPPPVPQPVVPPPLSIADLPMASSVPATYDLSTLFDLAVQPTWAMQQLQQRQHIDPRHLVGGSPAAGGSSDLQSLAGQLLHRPGSQAQHHGCLPCSEASPSPPPSIRD